MLTDGKTIGGGVIAIFHAQLHHGSDIGTGRSLQKKRIHFIGIVAAQEDGHTAVAFVAGETADAEFVGFLFGVMAKADALHRAGQAVFDGGGFGRRACFGGICRGGLHHALNIGIITGQKPNAQS